jgi:acetoin:2,6-dichlorophenolindophenol oxidoreductase subunit alpha
MTVKVDNDKLLAMYKNMVTIRLFETKVSELFAQGKLPGFIHLYIGEEAVATGVCAHLKKQDYLTSTHRGHGHLIAKGGDLNLMMAELYGKKTGYCKGKGGSMHIADVELGMLGANGIVGGGPPIASGAGFAIKYQGSDGVVVCFFGDAASNQGTFHEGVNLASVWKLPVVFVCENNLYGISVRQDRHQNISDVADRANAYDIPGVVVDGNDVMAVYEAAGEAIARARAGKGPSLVECKTYRWRGHFEGDPTPYRSKEELDSWIKRDPIPRFEASLKEMGVIDDAGLAAIKKDVGEKVEAAVTFSEESAWPALAEILDDVYTEPEAA